MFAALPTIPLFLFVLKPTNSSYKKIKTLLIKRLKIGTRFDMLFGKPLYS